MLGYPKIDEDNAYLITRYDGIIIDSKPWGHGLHQMQFDGKFQTFAEVYELEVRPQKASSKYKPNTLGATSNSSRTLCESSRSWN